VELDGDEMTRIIWEKIKDAVSNKKLNITKKEIFNKNCIYQARTLFSVMYTHYCEILYTSSAYRPRNRYNVKVIIQGIFYQQIEVMSMGI